MAQHKSCSVLMCTFNGADYLAEQLDSLLAQSIPRLDIYVSDDGSTDETLAILKDYAKHWGKGRFDILVGPRKGFAENFRSLLLRVPTAEYAAFCDQDDIWLPRKLDVAIGRLDSLGDEPALYGARSILVNEAGKEIGYSPLFTKPPGFGNALVQSLAGGNTMTFNRAAFVLLKESSSRTSFLMHDWWAYLIVSGAGGQVFYDTAPQILYRQHASNALGAMVSITERPKRLLELWKGRYVTWDNANLAALDTCSDLIAPANQKILRDFQALRKANGFDALTRLAKSGLYRQTRKGAMALAAAAFSGRL